ncbi:MAG: hypothetical protein KAX39_07660 [candidate division Zixibacteria bacterium]|nr:hypothetical protein [candidate division Zixibacteria bacterium]
MDVWATIVSMLANVLTIVASGIAIYLFVTKRKTVSLAFRALINYSSQMTLSELKAKLDRLNELTADDPQQAQEVRNILGDVTGQIQGNPKLSREFLDVLKKAAKLADGRVDLTEQRKRALVSELRERLRHANIEGLHILMGEKK